MKKKQLQLTIVFLLSFIFFIPVTISIDNNITTNDFYLLDYTNKADYNNKHVLKIGYNSKILLSKNDISFLFAFFNTTPLGIRIG